jgi:zona occludens toxin
MPITCYFGAPGSGKTYELVNRVMVEAVKQGRTIYHNIPGVSADEWAGEFGCDPDTIKFVPDSWFTDDRNFPADDGEFAQGVGVLKGGELLVCDEASTIVPSGTGRNSPVSARLDSFYRKHRHFTADVVPVRGGKPSRIAVDMYFATQDHQSIYQTILHLTALRVDFNELKGLFGRGAYRAVIYKSHRATKANRWGNPKVRKMDARGYKRYHSFAGGVDGEVATTEDSAKVWTKYRIFLFSLIPLLLLGGGYFAVTTVRDIFTIKKPAPIAAPIAANIGNRKLHPGDAASASAGAFDAAAAIKGECIQSLVDVDGRSFFDGKVWKPILVMGDRWVLGGCSIRAPGRT